MRASKVFLICSLAISLAIMLAIASGAGYVLFVRPLTLPVYHVSQRVPDADNFAATTLSLGSMEYVSGSNEAALEITAARTGWNSGIGRTDNGMDVYAIPPAKTAFSGWIQR